MAHAISIPPWRSARWQDVFSSPVIGLNGIAKTIIGYAASSLGVRIDVENLGSRFLMTFAF